MHNLKLNQLYLILAFLVVAINSCTKQTTYVEVPPIVENQQFNLYENSNEGTIVGEIRIENSQNQNLTFNLVKTENSEAFYINKGSGVIQLLDSSLVDYESIHKIELEVMIGYRTGLNDYAIFPKVTIDIIDQPETYEIILNSSSGNSFDGMVSSLNGGQNFLNTEFLYISTWTTDLVADTQRSFMYFDLSVLPTDITITNALLFLNNPNDGISEHEHSQLTGSNEFIIAPIISDWDSKTLTWGNQPLISFENQVEVEATLTNTQYMKIDVFALINEEYQNQANYFGMELYLKTEAYYRRLCFASMNNSNETLKPKLKVVYLK